MVVFSAFMMYAYTWKEYVVDGRPKTGVGRPLLDSVNYCTSLSSLPLQLMPYSIIDAPPRPLPS